MPEETLITADPETGPILSIEERIRLVLDRITTDRKDELSGLIGQWPPGDTATLLEALPQSVRPDFWELIPEVLRGEVLAWLGEQARKRLLKKLDMDDVVAATTDMEIPDLAEVIEEAPRRLRKAILESLDTDERADIEETLGYPEDTAGRLMERDWVAVHADVRLDEVKHNLSERGSLPHRTTALMVVDREGVFLGKLPLEMLLTRDSSLTVAEVMDTQAIAVNVLTPLSEVASLFERRDLAYLPVIDDERHLLGRIIVDDAIHLIRSEAEQPMMHMAGLEVDEDLLAPITASVRRRLLWLGINLVTAFLAAWVIGLFEATLDRIVALAVLMPIVASMGGIAGSQTLTLAIRGLALGQISDANTRWLAIKEVAISIINGIVWAIVVGVIAWLWFNQVGIALILGAAMVICLLVAAVSGLFIPLLLDKLGIDPALSGSVVLTTVTDVVGFMSFLGLATIFLL